MTIEGVCLGKSKLKRDAEEGAITFVGGKIVERGSEPREEPDP